MTVGKVTFVCTVSEKTGKFLNIVRQQNAAAEKPFAEMVTAFVKPMRTEWHIQDKQVFVNVCRL